MKITNKQEYLEAICVRRDLKRDVKEFNKIRTTMESPPEFHIAVSLVDILSLMITCYENGAETYLEIEINDDRK